MSDFIFETPWYGIEVSTYEYQGDEESTQVYAVCNKKTGVQEMFTPVLPEAMRAALDFTSVVDELMKEIEKEAPEGSVVPFRTH